MKDPIAAAAALKQSIELSDAMEVIVNRVAWAAGHELPPEVERPEAMLANARSLAATITTAIARAMLSAAPGLKHEDLAQIVAHGLSGGLPETAPVGWFRELKLGMKEDAAELKRDIREARAAGLPRNEALAQAVFNQFKKGAN